MTKVEMLKTEWLDAYDLAELANGAWIAADDRAEIANDAWIASGDDAAELAAAAAATWITYAGAFIASDDAHSKWQEALKNNK